MLTQPVLSTITLLLRVLCAISALTPPCSNDTCRAHRQRAAIAIVAVAEGEPDPSEAAALLVGTGVHETGLRTEHQVRGPAVTYWQLEVPLRERDALLADPAVAARAALRIARCGMVAYAGHDGPAAEELRRYVQRARWALR